MAIKHKEQRVAIFIDVQNMYHSARNLYNKKVNFAEILKIGVGEKPGRETEKRRNQDYCQNNPTTTVFINLFE